jgi:hypothetical protein
MKKLIIALAALALIASPALAVDWNFYGSARMQTAYVSKDLGSVDDAAGNDDDQDVQWDWGGNSRFGAKVKAESVDGLMEIGIRSTTEGGDETVNSRRLYGRWDFGAGKFKVGKDYTPVSQFVSGQAFGDNPTGSLDNGLLGQGAFYGGRQGQLALQFGGFEVALITPSGSTTVGTQAAANSEVDEYIPKIEAKWGMSLDMFSFNIMGGFQTYEIDGPNEDVDSYVIGGDAALTFGPAYIKAALSYGQNIGNAGWAGASGEWKASSESVKDTDTIQACLIAGFKFTDMVTFEAGYGYVDNSYDASTAKDDSPWEAYAQAVIALAPGVWVIPEVGYKDNDNYAVNDGAQQAGKDAGSRFYVNAKWQIDF